MESNTVNINDLPVIEEIVNGNYLLVEDETGSKILDFKNFVIGPNNTSFYNAIVTNINAVSTYCTSLSATVRNNTDQTLKSVDNRFNQLTAAFETRFGNFDSRYPKLFEANGTITVGPGASGASVVFPAAINTINVEDINIVCTTYDVSGRNGFNMMPVAASLSYDIAEVNTNNTFQSVTNTQTFYNYTLSISTLRPLDSNSPPFTYRYSVLKPFFST
jgi:hypothetical protein